MAKVNEFERGLDDNTYRDMRTDREANINYAYNGDDITDDLPALRTFILHHYEHQQQRLKTLHSYYEGINVTLLEGYRRKEIDKADHRASHPFAEYISEFTNGYFLGNPVGIKHEAAHDKLKTVHAYNDIDSLNRELGLDLSIYGRAYELAMKNTKDEYRFYRLKPEETFIIYDNSVEENSIAAVRYYPEDVNTNDESTYTVEVYTDDTIYTYTMQMQVQSNLKYVADESHAFGRVQITEYRNNRDRRGDFEKVLQQIDLYDRAQADTANYMSDLNDALLVISGKTDLDADEASKQKRANILLLEPHEYQDNQTGNIREGSLDAKYIYKQYDVAGSEAYKERLADDIHLLTNTPNMKDDTFGNSASGEALKYKLFGLEQKTVIKEGMFIKGLRRRYKLLQTIMQVDRELESSIDLKEIEYTFVRNLPKSLTEDLKTYSEAGGMLSQSTLLSLVGLVPDAEAEIEKLDAERELPEYDFEMSTITPAVPIEEGADV